MKIKNPPSIILALDIPIKQAEKLMQMLKPVEDKIAALKIGSLQIMEIGLKKAIADLRVFTELPVIYDHQKGCTDIPEIVGQQVEMAANSGADMCIAVPHGAGPKSLESFVNTCKRHNVLPAVLLEMTHPEANAYLKKNTAKKILESAIALGVEYFVCPGNKPEKIKEYKSWSKDIKILSPGIGARSGIAEDAVRAGTDFPIIGRQICNSTNPVAEVEKIYKECVNGFKRRL